MNLLLFQRALFLVTGMSTLVLKGAEPPSLAAILTHEQVIHTKDGMTKQVRFQERFIRRANHVWLERVLLGSKGNEKDENADAHHLSLDTAARYLRKDAQGQVKLEFVKPLERVIVQAEPRDYPEVGFDGSWDLAFHLIDPKALKSFHKSRRKSPGLGAHWFESKGQENYLRVLWSERLQIPLRIESGSLDGARSNRTSARLLPMPKELPWANLEGYRLKDYTDLLD
jgi:hypothetical protein